LERSLHKVSYEKLLTVFLVLFLLIRLPGKNFTKHFAHPYDFADRTNDKFYSLISQRSGTLAITGSFPLIALKTRRPILVDMVFINFFTYAPESALIFNNILKKIYGVDLLIPPPKHYQHREIPLELYKVLWEKRTVEQWQEIRDEFGVTDILTKTDWTLSLPVAAKSSDAILYQIPVVRE
jgi:hypothetical protein